VGSLKNREKKTGVAQQQQQQQQQQATLAATEQTADRESPATRGKAPRGKNPPAVVDHSSLLKNMDPRWMTRFNQAKAYEAATGNCNAPADVSPKSFPWNLGQFSACAAKDKDRLSPARETLLDGIAFVWEAPKGRRQDQDEQRSSPQEAMPHSLIKRGFFFLQQLNHRSFGFFRSSLWCGGYFKNKLQSS
jgi:hypothetical protein